MNLAALTQIQAAALLSVAPRTLRDWHDAPRNGDGTYPGPAIVAYYVAKLGTTTDYDNQRERLAAAQAERVEMENAVRRGQLVDIATIEKFWADCVLNARARLLGMGAKLGPQLVNLADPAVLAAAISGEARTALADLADYSPGDHADLSAVDASAAADGEPVGGSRASTEQRKRGRAGAVAN